MELRPGYKQTEMGVIPEDWDCRTLQELTDPARPVGYGIVQTGKAVRNGVKCIRVVDMVGGRIDPEQLITTSDVISQSYKRTLLRKNDLVIALRGKIGAVAVIVEELAGANLTRGVAILSANEDFHSGYLSQYLSSKSGKDSIEKNLNGSALQEIPIAALRKIPVIVPPLREQRAIAAALSDVDALLAKLDQLIAKKRDLKQAAMQQLLTGQTRLPGFGREWEVKRLGDVAHIKTGSRNNEDKVEDGEYPFFVRSEVIERINSYSHDCEAILVPGEGRIGSIFHYIEGRFDVHQRVYAITQFKPDMSAQFVHAYMAMNFGAWAMQNSVKATVDSLRLPTFQTFEMRVPPTTDEQTAIATILSDMDAEIAALEARRDKTRALKQGMMQELLTGRVRLV